MGALGFLVEAVANQYKAQVAKRHGEHKEPLRFDVQEEWQHHIFRVCGLWHGWIDLLIIIKRHAMTFGRLISVQSYFEHASWEDSWPEVSARGSHHNDTFSRNFGKLAKVNISGDGRGRNHIQLHE